MAEQQKGLDETKIIEDWELLFPSPEEAKKIKSIADQLIKTGMGKRKIKGKMETDLAYTMRIQYCIAKDIPLCFINSTYIIEGKVSEMVDLKMWRFKRAYPEAEFVVQCCNQQKMVKIGRVSPDHNWVKVDWSIEKAKILNHYHGSKKQWTDNPQSMLNARCNGQLIDILGGLESSGAGHLSAEEINNAGIDINPAEKKSYTQVDQDLDDHLERGGMF